MSTNSTTTTTKQSSSSSSATATIATNVTPPLNTTVSPSSAVPSAAGSGGNQDSLQSSASLYLYTFLATLVLLLGVSAAIVIRSLLLRRRHRRMIEEAIRNGTWMPPTVSRSRIDPSKKPRLFEAYLAASPDFPETNSKLKVAMFDEHQEWDGIMPFSVAYATSQASTQTPATPAQSTTDVTNSLTTFIPAQIRSRWRRTFASNSPPSSSLPTSMPASPLPQTPNAQTGSMSATPIASAPPSAPSSLRVAVLIAMPSPTPLSSVIQKNHTQHLEEDDLPHLEFGVAEVPVQEHHADVPTAEEKEGEVRKRSIGSSLEM